MKTKLLKNTKAQKAFKAEYDRLAKEIGKKFVQQADSVVEVIGRNECKAREVALAIGKALAEAHDALRGDAMRVNDGCDIFAAIAGHARCRLAPSALRNYARFFRLHKELTASGKDIQVSMYHYIAVAGWDDLKRQRQYLEQAERENLSVAELIEAIRGTPKTTEVYFRDLIEMLINGATSMTSQAYDALLSEKPKVTSEDLEGVESVQLAIANLAADMEGSR